jgi:colanic acid/amylovoran biosynthesis glycosyltransferase
LSETFIQWDVQHLLPGRVVVVADPPPRGRSVEDGPAWAPGGAPTLAFQPRRGDPPPSIGQRAAVSRFLSDHGVQVALVEYLDFADRWFEFLVEHGLRVWLRAHGVDISARLREERWRAAYRRYRAAEGIIVPSRAAVKALIAATGLPAAKVLPIPYCVQVPPERKPIYRPGGMVRCVAVGRLVPKKAPLLVLEAFRQAAQRSGRLSLDMVGDGPLMDQVRRYVDAHRLSSRVHLYGSLPHRKTLGLVSGSDILLHHAVTSPEGDSEGQPLAVLEAMAAGACVIATRHAGIPEIVEDGTSGRLLAEGDVPGMATAVVELADDPVERHRLGQAARRTILAGHTYGHARRALLSLLRPPIPE